jgi:hypothetical protein
MAITSEDLDKDHHGWVRNLENRRQTVKFFRAVALSAVVLCLEISGFGQSTAPDPLANTQSPKLTQLRPVASGPFGLLRGMTKEQILDKVGQSNVVSIETDKAGGVTIFLKSVPKPYKSFIEYGVTISPAQGLLRISAFTDFIDTALDGTQLRDAFSSLKDQLQVPYGFPSKEFDYVKNDSLWKDPQDFMMGMLKHDRKLSCYWVADEKMPLKDSITAIALWANAKDTSTGMILLSYEFDGWTAYSEALESKEGSVL